AQKVFKIQSSPPGGGRAKLREQLYPLPGDRYTTYELWAFDAASHKATKVDADPIDFYGPPAIRWQDDNKHFLFHKTDRGHQRFRIYNADSQTGAAKTVYDEQAKTFINTTYDSFIYYTKGNAEVLFASEKDGWKQLYLIDANSGAIHPI